MFDNVAFEVVIGLVFIYLLYSLLVTILGEIISNTFGIRARLLRIAIERMLNDGYFFKINKHQKTPKFIIWLRGQALKEHPEFKNSVAGKFYDYPAIKYLGRLEKEKKDKLSVSKPSYISADYFADALINFLADKGAGSSLFEKVKYCLRYNTHHIQPNTLRQFNNLFESSDGIEQYKQNIIKWFNETMDRASGWHKRKMRLISFIIGLVLAMAFNVDTIQIAKVLATDKEARAQLVNMGIAMAKDSAMYAPFTSKNGDTVHAAAILDSSFKRVSEDINAANVVLGLGWDISDKLKPDNIDIVEKNGDDALRKNADALQTLANARNLLNERIKDSGNRLSIYRQQIDSLYADTTIAKNELIIGTINDTTFFSRIATDTNMAAIIKSKAAIISTKLKTDSVSLATNNSLSNSLFTSFSKELSKKFIVIDSISHPQQNITRIHGKRYYTGLEKLGYVFSHIVWYSLIGFIITALALSMGAPFWFDLLNKLVSIRGVGVKPEEKKITPKTEVLPEQKTAEPAETKTVIATKEEQQETALNLLTLALKEEDGIVATVLVPGNDAHLLIMVESKDVEKYLIAKYGRIQKLEPDFSIPIKFEVQEAVVTHDGMTGGEIGNETGALGFGTLGCFLKKKGTANNYILSCWHVMKDNARYAEGIIEKDIVEKSADESVKIIASVEQGCIADNIDIGIAVCLDRNVRKNPEHSIRTQHRNVTSFDSLMQTPVSLYGKVSKKQNATVIHHKLNIQLTYPGGVKFLINDVFSISKESSNGNFTSPTSPGDSGAVVIDEKGTPLGMIIGGNGAFSYAVKFSNMFDADKPYKEYFFLTEKPTT